MSLETRVTPSPRGDLAVTLSGGDATTNAGGGAMLMPTFTSA